KAGWPAADQRQPGRAGPAAVARGRRRLELPATDTTRAARLPVPVGVPRAVRPGGCRSRGRDRRRARGPAPGRLLAADAARDRPGRAVPLLDAADPARIRPAAARAGGRGTRG